MKGIWLLAFASLLLCACGPGVDEHSNQLKFNAQMISAGGSHSCMIDDQGRAWCWGDNSSGQLGTESDDSKHFTPLQVGDETDWTQIACGVDSSCGIKKDGSLWCWGSNNHGQLGTLFGGGGGTPSPVSFESAYSAQQISASKFSQQTCAIGKTGELWCWGYLPGLNDSLQITLLAISSENQWRSVETAETHTCAIRYDNSLWCWGVNWVGELGNDNFNPTVPVPNPQQVGSDMDWNAVTTGSGNYNNEAGYTCGIRKGGELYCFGGNQYGQLGLGLTAGFKVGSATRVGTETDWSSISAGVEHTCGIRKDNSLWCWGNNSYGDVGVTANNDNLSTDTPQQVTGGEKGWKVVSAGYQHTCAIDENNQAWCWGYDSRGQLGNDIRGFYSSTPVKVE